MTPSALAVLVGLGAIGSAGCEGSSSDSDDGSGGFGDAPSYTTTGNGWTGVTTSSSYGTASTGWGPSTSTTGADPTTGPSGPATSTGSGMECPVFGDDGGCQSCLSNACCDEGITCVDTPECVIAQGCLAECEEDDLACATGCQEANPAGFALYQSLYQCAATSCPGCLDP